MQTVLLVAHLIIALGLIGVVLLQRSEGGALGIGGSGGAGSGNLFSARGVGNALTRTTAWLAVAFFATSIVLTILATHRTGSSVIDQVAPTQNQTAPATGGTAPAGDGTAPSGGSVLPNLDGQPAQPQVPVGQ